jgi:hypothetical protein
LEPVVETAAQTWWRIQRRRSRFEADTSARLDDHWGWQAIEFNEDGIGIAALGADFTSDEAVVVREPGTYPR